jgi:hypothetical protein
MFDQYFVIVEDGEWKVLHDQKRDGPYISQRAAITAAVARAKIAAKKGRPAQVMVQTGSNMFREEWSYDSDSHPLRSAQDGINHSARRN